MRLHRVSDQLSLLVALCRLLEEPVELERLLLRDHVEARAHLIAGPVEGLIQPLSTLYYFLEHSLVDRECDRRRGSSEALDHSLDQVGERTHRQNHESQHLLN